MFPGTRLRRLSQSPADCRDASFDTVAQRPYGPIPVARVPGGNVCWPIGSAPLKGEHTDAILAEAGIDSAERAALTASGVIFQAADPRTVPR